MEPRKKRCLLKLWNFRPTVVIALSLYLSFTSHNISNSDTTLPDQYFSVENIISYLSSCYHNIRLIKPNNSYKSCTFNLLFSSFLEELRKLFRTVVTFKNFQTWSYREQKIPNNFHPASTGMMLCLYSYAQLMMGNRDSVF